MPKVSVLELNPKTLKFEYLAEPTLAAVPTKNDRIVLDVEGVGYVCKVLDVHLADNMLVDVFVVRISTITDYNSTLSYLPQT